MSDIDASIISVSPSIERKNIRWQAIVACTYLVVMCIQYTPLEGWGVSPIKVGLMCISPLFLILLSPGGTEAMIWGGLYLLWVFSDTFLRFSSPRIETMVYSLAFFLTYMMFYNLVCKSNVFSIDYFLNVMRVLIYSYTIVLIIQQLISLAGLNSLPVINLGEHDPVMKCQSLSLEPAHSARILTAAFYAIISLTDIQTKNRKSIASLWKKEKKIVICFLYSMLSMTSGTAIACIFLVFTSFFSFAHFIPLLVLLPFLYYLVELFQSEQVFRVSSVVNALISGADTEAIVEADQSASFRIMPIVNSFRLDFSDLNTWIGYGTDSFRTLYFDSFGNSRDLVNGTIRDYGLIGYFLSLCFVFRCCIHPFFSLMTILFLCGFGGGTMNIAYGWGILMIFTCVSFFRKNANLK